MNNVEVIEDFLEDNIRVSVNGEILKDADGNDRTFTDSISAAVAGAKEVDRQREASSAGAKP